MSQQAIPRILSKSRNAVLSFLTVLRYHRKAALSCFLAVVVCGLAIGYAVPKHYTATVNLWLDRGGRASDAQDAVLTRNTELRLLTSSELVGRTVDALGLDRVRGVGQPSSGPPRERNSARRRAITTVRSNLRIDEDASSYTVSLHFRAWNPTLAAGVVNRLADLYVKDRQDLPGRDRTLASLRQRAAAAHEAVVRSRAAEEGYRSAIASIRGDNGPTAETVRLLDIRLHQARSAVTAAQTRLRAASSLSSNKIPTISEPEQRQAQRVPEGDAGGWETDRRPYADRRLPNRLGAEADGAIRRLAEVTAERDVAIKALNTARQTDAQVASLRAAADLDSARYNELADDIRSETAAAAASQSTAYVIARALPGTVSATPGRLLVLLVSLVSAAAATAVLLLVLERLQKGFRSQHGIEEVLGLPSIGMVPDLSLDHKVRLANSRLAVPDYLVYNRNSDFAQVFQAILSTLRSDVAGRRAQVLTVSSALPEEGKTTVAVCLARTAAVSGLRTVLVDCDVRRPAASRALVPTLQDGLTEVLNGGLPLAEALRCDEVSGAQVLGIGSNRRLSNPTIDVDGLRALTIRLRKMFDVVIFDTPPALALTESRGVAALADAVLLVARYRRTPKDAVMIAHDLLKRSGAPVVATALTLVDG